MTFAELLSNVQKIQCQEVRQQAENYLEIVVALSDLDPLTAVLQTYFGEPLKPAGQPPSQEASRFSEPYGGIAANQTMYVLERERDRHLAMLWPWGSGQSITVKIIKE